MSDDLRNTQFKNFAKLLLKELVDDMLDEYGFMERGHYECGDLNTAEELIARRAYDLVKHAVTELQHDDIGHADSWVQQVTDMTELPKDELTPEEFDAMIKNMSDSELKGYQE